jgi:hypothetical protein
MQPPNAQKKKLPAIWQSKHKVNILTAKIFFLKFLVKQSNHQSACVLTSEIQIHFGCQHISALWESQYNTIINLKHLKQFSHQNIYI